MIPEKPQIITAPLCYAGDTRNIPVTTPQGTNQFSYEAGFPPLTATPVQFGGIAPDRKDFNAAFKLLSTFIYYMQSGNQFVWDALLDYNKGATVLGSDGALYFCIQANGATSPNTVQDPVSTTGYWVKVIDAQGVFNINIIADGAVSTAKLANSSVTNAKIANTTITGNKLVNGTITATQIADTTITNAKLANATITGAKLANATITGAKLANDTITAAQIAANAITSSELADNAVDATAIAANAVTNAKIANSAVNNAKISDVAASKVTGLARVATSGSYNDLSNKPTIPTNFPPKPVSGTGTAVGVWRADITVGNTYTLPAGGTWAWSCLPVTADGNIVHVQYRAGVNEGGTTVVTISDFTYVFYVLLWRVQ